MDHQLKLQRRYEREDRRARREAYGELLGTYAGRKLLWHLLESYGVRRTPFRTNALQMSFECGMQNAGLILEAELTEFFPEAYQAMMQEMSNERNGRTRDLADAARRGDDGDTGAGDDEGN